MLCITHASPIANPQNKQQQCNANFRRRSSLLENQNIRGSDMSMSMLQVINAMHNSLHPQLPIHKTNTSNAMQSTKDGLHPTSLPHQQKSSLGGTRTRSFLIRSQTRYHCATRDDHFAIYTERHLCFLH